LKWKNWKYGKDQLNTYIILESRLNLDVKEKTHYNGLDQTHGHAKNTSTIEIYNPSIIE